MIKTFAEPVSHVYADKIDALKVIKLHKNARLKSFKNRMEAENFARNGQEEPFDNQSDDHVIATEQTVGEEKSSNFKGPKSQDLVRFRKLIESGDVEAVRSFIWENPRYLVSSGDTPAILQVI